MLMQLTIPIMKELQGFLMDLMQCILDHIDDESGLCIEVDVLGKANRPVEALNVLNSMQQQMSTYLE
nr:hypothetical protein CFP56_27959 [Quercus suber]